MNKTKIDELEMGITDYKKLSGKLSPDEKKTLKITADKPTTMMEDDMLGPEAVIEPQDKETIKYLSNVKDERGNISQPFTIGDKRYQMVRGMKPSKEIVMAVYCFDDLNESGENMIHSVEHFDKTVATPMREMLEKTMTEELQDTNDEPKKTQPKAEPSSDDARPATLGLADYKHFIVNNKSGKFKKFKTIPELATYTMNEDEKYMGLSEFKKYFESKVFGNTRKTEAMQQPMDDNAKADKFIQVIQSKITPQTIETLKSNKDAQEDVLVKFAELIGVDKSRLGSVQKNIKGLANNPQPVTENRVIKTIKVKDIK